MLEIGIRKYVTGHSSNEDTGVLNGWSVMLCNDFINRERAAAGLPPFPDLGRPYSWEHWEFARPLITLFWGFSLSKTLPSPPYSSIQKDEF